MITLVSFTSRADLTRENNVRWAQPMTRQKMSPNLPMNQV